MNQLIVVTFDHLEDARTAMQRLRSLESEGRIRFEDTAVVEREADGKAHVRNEVSGTTEGAAVVGAIIGGALAFAFPLAGIALGAALGAAVGNLLDTGVSGKFVDELKTTLTPGSISAIPRREGRTGRWADRGPSGLRRRGHPDDARQRGRGRAPRGAQVSRGDPFRRRNGPLDTASVREATRIQIVDPHIGGGADDRTAATQVGVGTGTAGNREASDRARPSGPDVDQDLE